jgi:hypothetical protein
MIIAAVCHDVGNNGFSGRLYQNIMMERGVQSSNIYEIETF